MNSPIRCAKCGAQNRSSSIYCSLCYSRISGFGSPERGIQHPAVPFGRRDASVHMAAEGHGGTVIPFPRNPVSFPTRHTPPSVRRQVQQQVAAEAGGPPVSSQNLSPSSDESARVDEPGPALIPTGHDPFDTSAAADANVGNSDLQQRLRRVPEYRSVFDYQPQDAAIGNGHDGMVGVLYEVPTYIEEQSEAESLPAELHGGIDLASETAPPVEGPTVIAEEGTPNEGIHTAQVAPNFESAPLFQEVKPGLFETMQSSQPGAHAEVGANLGQPIVQFPTRTEPAIEPSAVQPAIPIPAAPPAWAPPVEVRPFEVATNPDVSLSSGNGFEIAFDPGAVSSAVDETFGDADSLVVRWSWRHLIAFLAAAWIMPTLLTALVVPRLPTQAAFNAAFVLQLFGYAVAGIVAARIVRTRFQGNWSVFGIHRDQASLDEFLRGAAFGIGLLALFIPIGIVLNGGRFGLDRMVRVIVGETTPIGLLLAGIMIVVGAPFIEEIFFRSMLFAKFFARFGKWAAIIGTTILFVLAHGALIIIPLLILGFGLAWKRQTHRLWYTIGAHAAWNLVVMCMGAYLVLGPPATVSPQDGSYSVRHQLTWERVHRAEQELETGSIDFALEDSRGSGIAVGRANIPLMNPDEVLPVILTNVGAAVMEDAEPAQNTGTPEKTSRILDGFPVVWEIRGGGHSNDVGEFRTHAIATVHNGSGTVYVFSMFCPVRDCAYAGAELEDVLKSFDLKK